MKKSKYYEDMTFNWEIKEGVYRPTLLQMANEYYEWLNPSPPNVEAKLVSWLMRVFITMNPTNISFPDPDQQIYNGDEDFYYSFSFKFLQTYKNKEIAVPSVHEFNKEVIDIWRMNKYKWESMFVNFKNALASDPLVESLLTTETRVDTEMSSKVESDTDSLTESEMVSKTERDASTSLLSEIIRRFNETPQSQVSSLDDGYLTSLTDENQDNTTHTDELVNVDGSDKTEGNSTSTVDTTSDQGTDSFTTYKGRSKSEMELLDQYRKYYYDMLDDMMLPFRSLFLYIY